MVAPMISLLLTSLGCVEGAIEAPYSARLKGPEDYTVSWHSDYNELQDQVGVVIMGDVMVYDSETDLPLESIEVEMTSNFGGVYLIPAEAVKLVGYPEATVDPTDTDAIRQACTDEAGNFTSDPEWCAWYWDTETEQYYQIGGQYVATASEYAPNYFVGRTNNRGILEFYLYVDAMPAMGGAEGAGVAFGTTQISANIGVDSTSFEIRTSDQ